MNDVLVDTIRHHNWATRRVLAFCRERDLTDEQLDASAIGAYGSIRATLNHIVSSDASYLRQLLGSETRLIDVPQDADLAALEKGAEALETFWEKLLVQPIDVERVVIVDDGSNEVEAGVFLAQSFNHGNLHREQVCAMLTSLGIEPPDLQAWEYAWTTGRLRIRNA
jgi:uncharacterized damage-inducible protein DinB